MTDTTMITHATAAVQALSAKHAWAAAYAKAGYKVLPLNPDCSSACVDPKCSKPKEPLGMLAPRGLHNATNDLDVINNWWNQFPNANIGIACRASGIIAIDLDTHKPDENGIKNFDLLKGDNRYPSTPLQLTPGGSGGRHIICKHPAPDDIVVPKVTITDEQSGEVKDAGIDTRSNHYIVVSPSTSHGKLYSWLVGCGLLDIAPIELPDWLRSILVTKSAPTKTTERIPNALSAEDREVVMSAIAVIPADDYDIWLKVGMALKFGGFDLQVWDEWSRKSPSYQHGACAKKWASFRRDGVKIGTIFHYAKQHGFAFPKNFFPRTDSGNAARLAANFGHLLRWHRPERNWLVWDGRRWKSDNTERPVAYAKETAALILKKRIGRAAMRN